MFAFPPGFAVNGRNHTVALNACCSDTLSRKFETTFLFVTRDPQREIGRLTIQRCRCPTGLDRDGQAHAGKSDFPKREGDGLEGPQIEIATVQFQSQKTGEVFPCAFVTRVGRKSGGVLARLVGKSEGRQVVVDRLVPFADSEMVVAQAGFERTENVQGGRLVAGLAQERAEIELGTDPKDIRMGSGTVDDPAGLKPSRGNRDQDRRSDCVGRGWPARSGCSVPKERVADQRQCLRPISRTTGR